MTWTNLSWTDGDILTSADANSLVGNFSGIFSGDTGAPVIKGLALEKELSFTTEDEVHIAAGAVWIIPVGMVNIFKPIPDSGFSYDVVVQTISLTWLQIGLLDFGLMVLSDGVKFRLYNSGSVGVTVKYIIWD